MIESAFPIVEVPDLERALGFYRDLLGAQVVYTYPADGDPVFATLQAGSSQLGLGLADGSSGGAGVGILLWFYVVDVRDTVAQLEAAGVEVVEAPHDTEWGERMALVTDPFGTRVRLAQPLHAQPEEE